MSEDKKKEILIYCKDNMKYMWASTIVGILLDCDFRDSEHKLNEYLESNYVSYEQWKDNYNKGLYDE